MAKLPTPPIGPSARGVRIGLVTSDFNQDITGAMREDARATAKRLGATITVDVHVPGVFDIPLTASKVLQRKDVDALVAIGAVITGETRHDEVVAFECARQLATLALEHEKPVGLGVTGPGQTEAQARARIDRGGWAVQSVCSQFKTLRLLSKPDARGR